MTDVSSAIHNDVDVVVGYLPRLGAALVLMLIGWIFAWLAGRFVCALAARLGADEMSQRTGLRDDMARVGVRATVSLLLGRLAFFVVFIAALVQSVDALELTPLSDSLHALLLYAPHLILAALVLLAGPVVGELLSVAAVAALSRSGVLYHALIGGALRAFVIVLALFMALQQLTIDASFLRDVILISLASVGLMGAVAFGWATRTLAENLLGARYVEQNFAVGDGISVDGVSGRIEKFGPQSVTIVSGDDARAVIPNAILARTVIHPDPQRRGPSSVE